MLIRLLYPKGLGNKAVFINNFKVGNYYKCMDNG